MNPVLEVVDRLGALGVPVLVFVINAPPERRQRAPAARKPSARRASVALDAEVERWVEGKAAKARYRGLPSDARAPDGRVLRCTVEDVLRGALGLEDDAMTRAQRASAGAAMARLKWHRSRPEVDGVRFWRWSRP